MTVFRADASNVTDLSQKRAERKAGYEKLAALETPDADLIAERDRVDSEWEAWTLKQAPLTEKEAREKVARRVDDAKSQLLKAGQLCADRDDLRGIHARLAYLALEVAALSSDLADLGGAA